MKPAQEMNNDMKVAPNGMSGQLAYDVFAPVYDHFTHRYLNERWTETLTHRAEHHGLKGRRLLDVGCGTGKSFIPMLDRGWNVVACDISPAMLSIARSKVRGNALLLEVDVREMPHFDHFDLVWALDDTLNYLLSVPDLCMALQNMAKNLRPGGILIFDMNTLLTYRTFFCSNTEITHGGHRLLWRGCEKESDVRPRSICRATVEATDGAIPAHTHYQRHFGWDEVQSALESAELTCLEIAGDAEGVLDGKVDESVHSKAIYFCTK
jgi:SAM-dependent methyltransferase